MINGKSIVAVVVFTATATSSTYTSLANNKDGDRQSGDIIRENVVKIAFWNTMNTLDPGEHTQPEQGVLMDALYEGLVRIDPKKGIVPAQAASWVISPDGTNYVFSLRDDMTWSDGTPVVGEDFVLAFQRIVDPAHKTPPRPSYLLTTIKNARAIRKGEKPVSELGISAPDSKTVAIELEAPASYFLEILDYPGLGPVPSHLVKKHGNEWWRQKPLVSNGTYKLEDSSKDNFLSLKLRDTKKLPQCS